MAARHVGKRRVALVLRREPVLLAPVGANESREGIAAAQAHPDSEGPCGGWTEIEVVLVCDCHAATIANWAPRSKSRSESPVARTLAVSPPEYPARDENVGGLSRHHPDAGEGTWRIEDPALAPDDPDLFLEVVRYAETRNYIRGIYEIYNIYLGIYSPVVQ